MKDKLIADLCKSLAECVFVVESVAHLQGLERELLPIADRARELLDSIEVSEHEGN